MSLFSNIAKAWASTALYGKTFYSTIQLAIAKDNTTEKKADHLYLEFRKNFIIIRDMKTNQGKQIPWKFHKLDQETKTYTFQDEKYGQWLISDRHITFTNMNSMETIAFLGKIL